MVDFNELLILKTIGDGVEKRRKKLGMTQAQLAKAAGTTQPSISSLEEGKDSRISSLVRVSKALSCSIDELLGMTSQNSAGSSLGHAIARRIQDERKRRGWSVEVLAEKAHISLEKLQDIEERFTSPGKHTRAALAAVFEIDEQQLLMLPAQPPTKSQLQEKGTQLVDRRDPEASEAVTRTSTLIGEIVLKLAALEERELRKTLLFILNVKAMPDFPTSIAAGSPKKPHSGTDNG